MHYKFGKLQLLLRNCLRNYLITRVALVTSTSPSSNFQSNTRGKGNHNWFQQSWTPPANPPQYRPTVTLWSPWPPTPLTQFGNSRYLGRCQICGMTRHSARQCSYLSTSALESLPLVPPRVLRPTFTAPYAHIVVHYSNTTNSQDWVLDSSSSHNVTIDLATLVLHELYHLGQCYYW